MNKSRRLAAGIGLLAAVGIAALGVVHLTRPAPSTPKLSLACKPSQQLITKLQNDWLILHTPAANCREDEIQVIYTSGEIGLRHYRSNLTLETETISTADGIERKHVVYDASGSRPIEASEDWLDGTPSLRMSTDKAGLRTTTRYWPNGQVFSIEKAPGTGVMEVTYFYDSGTLWAHYAGKTGGDGSNIVPRADKLDVQTKDGLPLLQIAKTDGGWQYKIFRPDGTLAYVQNMTTISWYVGPRLATIDIYSDDGQRVVRQFTTRNGSYLDRVVDIAEDGSKVQYELESYQENIISIKHLDAHDGSVVSSEQGDKSSFKYDRNIVKLPVFANPDREWDQLVERNIYGR